MFDDRDRQWIVDKIETIIAAKIDRKLKIELETEIRGQIRIELEKVFKSMIEGYSK